MEHWKGIGKLIEEAGELQQVAGKAIPNEIKQHGVALGELVEKLRNNRPGLSFDQRWVSIGATDLQTGLMALTRAVTKPTFF